MPDVVTPEMHIKMALRVRHPFSLRVLVRPAVQKALHEQPDRPEELDLSRSETLSACQLLGAALSGENKPLISCCHQWVATVLKPARLIKHITVMRELFLLVGCPDLEALPFL